MKKELVLFILLIFIASNAYSQKEYRLIEGYFGESASKINDLVSQGFNIEHYSVYTNGAKNVEYRYHESAIMSKDNSTQNKSYLFLKADSYYYIYLYGDIPTGFLSKYTNLTLENIINDLSNVGYTIEYFTYLPTTLRFIVLSKIKSGGPNAIRNIDNDNDEISVIEKARYNLNGNPVNESEKGIQIIVYSDYTTKIVNVK